MGHRKVNTRRRRPLPPQKFRKGGGGGNNKLCSEREKKSSEPAPYGPRPKRACFRLQLSGNWSDETFFSLSLHLPPIALGSGLAPRKLLLRSDPPYVEACFLKHRPKNNKVPSIPLPLRSHAAKPTPSHVRTYDITLVLLRPRTETFLLLPSPFSFLTPTQKEFHFHFRYAPPAPHSARQGVGVYRRQQQKGLHKKVLSSAAGGSSSP